MSLPTSSRKDPEQENLRDLARWLILVPVVILILFICGFTATFGLGYPSPGDDFEIRSKMRADYSIWDYMVVHPVSAAILDEIISDMEHAPDQLVIPGNFWPGPTSPPQPALTSPTGTATTTHTPTWTTRPTQTQTAPASLTATPTRTLAPTATNRPAIRYYPTSTRTQTPDPPQTRTYTPSATAGTSATPSPSGTASTTPTSTSATQTPTQSPNPSHTGTPHVSHTPTSSAMPTYTPSPSVTSTPRPTGLRTPYLSSTPTGTPSYTPTSTQTPSPTSTATPTSSPTFTSTSTPTPTNNATSTNTSTPTSTATNTPIPCGGNIPPGEPDIGPPDGSYATFACGSIWVIDLVANGYSPIDTTLPDPDFDIVFFERQLPPPPADHIALDWVTLQVGTGPSGSCSSGEWFTALNWGDGDASNNGHLAGSYPEIDNQQIPFGDLYGTYPLQTGIAIDLDALGLSDVYPCILIYSPINWPDNDGSETDAVQILP